MQRKNGFTSPRGLQGGMPALAAVLVLLGLGVATAQPLSLDKLLGPPKGAKSAGADPAVGDSPGLGKIAAPAAGAKDRDEPVAFRLVPANAKPGDTVTFSITVLIAPGSYTYSTTSPAGGTAKIEVKETPGLEPIGDDFRPDHPPVRIYEPLFKKDVEKYLDNITWSRAYRVAAAAKPADVRIKGMFHFQVCNENACIPHHVPFDVGLSDGDAGGSAGALPPSQQPKPAAHPFSFMQARAVPGAGTPITLRAKLSPEDAKPGDEVTVAVTASLKEGWHTYSLTQDLKNSGTPTAIEAPALNGLVPIDAEWTADRPFEEKELVTPEKTYHQEIHHGDVTWTRRFRVAPNAAETGYGVAGTIRYQICEGDLKCLPKKTVEFALGRVDDRLVGGLSQRASAGNETDKDIIVTDAPREGALSVYLLYAFLGGLILNIMPCVLPVIAIKVMSFVQQAGESRSRIFLLNAVYALGVVSVFLGLAALSLSLKIGWGGLFRSSEFNLIMACVVFAMGLSLLGVFEIPVPGFIGSSASSAQREGLLGAFLTGVLATLLATPCSGPFMGSTLAWSVQQTTEVTLLVWGVMGLGMASPYLIFGLFPAAVRLLPKPGMWMVRLKEFAGFVLMGTVIFFIYFLEKSYTIPLLTMLLGISLGLWMIGNLYDVNSHIRHKMAVRVTAFALASAICVFGYSLRERGTALPWEPFTEKRLSELRAQRKTVLIDFTANWCLVCKANETFALNTSDTLELVRKHDIVPLYADYTHESPEIAKWLGKFQSISVPLTAIFPGNRPNEPIIIRDAYTKSTLLAKLREAVNADENASRQADRQTAAEVAPR